MLAGEKSESLPLKPLGQDPARRSNLILRAHLRADGSSILGLAAIENLLSGVQHPIAFLDYEISAAHPITNVTGPPHCGTENLAPTGRKQSPNFALCGRFYRFRWG